MSDPKDQYVGEGGDGTDPSLPEDRDDSPLELARDVEDDDPENAEEPE